MCRYPFVKKKSKEVNRNSFNGREGEKEEKGDNWGNIHFQVLSLVSLCDH